jgi:hypothetical protein
MKNNISIVILITLISVILGSCEDPVPYDDYIPRKIIESYLLVGQPIEDVSVTKTQPLNIAFNTNKSRKEGAELVESFFIEELASDGKVVKSLQLEKDSTLWHAIDRTYLVKAETKYKLRIKFKDGDSATGETTTPQQISWNPKYQIKKFVQFPLDTINLPSTDTLGWSSVPNVGFYLIGILNLDTLEYGKYLNPPFEQKNRRITGGGRGDNFFKEASTNVLIANTKSSVVWRAFKWYGKHEVAMYAPDFNMIRWFLANRGSRDYNPLLGSLNSNNENTFGFFASASVVRDTFVLVKNQP